MSLAGGGSPRIRAHIAVLGGDGIGPEVALQGMRVLRAVAESYGHIFEMTPALVGGAAIDATGSALHSLDTCS